MRYSEVAAAVALVATGACAALERQASTVAIRDSAGIRIIENVAPAHPDAPWALDAQVLVDPGGDVDPHQEFSGRVHPFRLDDGRLVIANGGSYELRFFDPDGRWRRSVGRRGGGPGEFQGLDWLDLGPGDTLWTYDFSLRRLSVFSPEGAFLRHSFLRMPDEQFSPRPIGVMDDGRLIVQGQKAVTPTSRSGAGREVAPVYAFDAEGAVSDSLGQFPDTEHLIETGPGSVSVSSLPFGREVPVTFADIDTLLVALGEEWRPGEEAMRDRFLARMKEAPLPKWKPPYAGLLIGPERSLWIRRYTEPARAAPTAFEVFDSTGRWLGGITMPAGYDPTQSMSGFVVGTWKDANDVPHVRVYRLGANATLR